MPDHPVFGPSHHTPHRVPAAVSEDHLGSYSLDMIAPITEGPLPDAGGLLSLWDDVVVAELPPMVRAYAVSQNSVTPTAILKALLEPSAVAEACTDFIETARSFMTAEFDARSAEVALLRGGLLTKSVPTLEEIGKQIDVTRERVRQIAKCGEGVLIDPEHVDAKHGRLRSTRDMRLRGYGAAKVQGVTQRFAQRVIRHPLAHTMRAWFDLHRNEAVTDSDLRLLAPSQPQTRCCQRVLDILRYPHTSWNGNFWFRTEAERRAFEAVLGAADAWTGAKDWTQVVARMRASIPGVEHLLDLEATVRRLGEVSDFGLGLDGRIVGDRSRLVRRVARKIVTFLVARATPVPIDELATAISVGQMPFHVFLRPSVSATWLHECIMRVSDLLIELKDGRVALAPSLAASAPTGMVGILYAIVSRHGEPIRMKDLCDKAAAFGLSRNQTGSLIHSRRAACLFMLSRGIVGLVGRDEAANSAEYEAANPGRARKRVRPGREIGCEEDGALAADIQVRRSIREQGLGLPWPFSLVLFNGASHLFVDDERVPFMRKPNGDLDLPQLVPGSVVRLVLRRGTRGSVLWLKTKPRTPLDPIHLTLHGATFPLGLPPSRGRPGWVAEFERRHEGKLFEDLDAASSALPAALSERRRVYALHAFVALGIVRHTSKGWKVAAGEPLPAAMDSAFQLATDDPRAYPALVGDSQAAAAWLVRAAWLTPNLGWSLVRHNDLSRDVELDPLLPDAGAPVSVGIREAALMRVVETAEVAEDRLVHPGAQDLLDETGILTRRYLTALGYTAYRAVRELVRAKSWASISYAQCSDGAPSGVWILKPVGAPIGETDLATAKRTAKKVGAETWAVTNGLRLQGAQGRLEFDIDLRAVARVKGSFEQLIRLAANPSDFVCSKENKQNGDAEG